jgi:AcrR family transcriptional regulator
MTLSRSSSTRRRQSKLSASALVTPRRANTRERLLRSAHWVLQEGGYAAASVQTIAERAGVATGALYRHYASKAELFVEVFRDAANRDLEAMQKAAVGGSCIQRLEAVVTTFARRALSNRRLAWALAYEPVDPPVDAERLIHRREYCRHLASLLRAGMAAGEIPEQNAELIAAALVGAIAEALLGPLSPIAQQRATKEQVVAMLVRFCRQSVGAC